MSTRAGRPRGASKRCIFCDAQKLTGEHIWPQWASPLLPDENRSEMVLLQTDHLNETRMEMRRVRQGSAKLLKIKAVCGACNSGWMSGLEEDNRLQLTSMIGGRQTVLDKPRQRDLAAWITLKLMVAEHSRTNQDAFTPEERQRFRESREIPPNLLIQLFRCGYGRTATYYHRRSWTVSTTGRLPATGLRKNFASAAMGIGELFVLALYVSNPEMQLQLRFAADTTLRIHPPSEPSVQWPPPRRLSEREAMEISETFAALERDPNVSRVAPPYFK